MYLKYILKINNNLLEVHEHNQLNDWRARHHSRDFIGCILVYYSSCVPGFWRFVGCSLPWAAWLSREYARLALDDLNMYYFMLSILVQHWTGFYSDWLFVALSCYSFLNQFKPIAKKINNYYVCENCGKGNKSSWNFNIQMYSLF